MFANFAKFWWLLFEKCSVAVVGELQKRAHSRKPVQYIFPKVFTHIVESILNL